MSPPPSEPADPNHSAAHGTSAHLVQMANDIGNFFRAEPDRQEAIAAIANHIAKFWTRRMREKLIQQLKRDATGLDELPREALRRLEEHPAPRAYEPPGGDAG